MKMQMQTHQNAIDEFQNKKGKRRKRTKRQK